jgi:hypothetical protein
MELTVNSNFHLYTAKGRRKRQTSVCLLLTLTENGNLFSLIGNRFLQVEFRIIFTRSADRNFAEFNEILPNLGWILLIKFRILKLGY